MTVPISRVPLANPSAEVDVAIVGAGAAGIAAARACLARGLTVAVLEARRHVGGRCVTASFGGHPVDLGAHWLHAGDLNPLVPLARRRGERLRRAPTGGAVVTDGRFENRAARHGYAKAFDQADLAFSRAARCEADMPLSAAMPPLGRWRDGIAATMALVSGRPLDEVSLRDFPSDEFGDNYFVRGGYGAYLARLAIGLPVRLGCPVARIDWSGRGVTLDTPAGRVSAEAAIVTVPMPVLAAGGIAFSPALPALIEDAAAAFLPGTYEHVILNWPSLPGHGPDSLVKIKTGRTVFGMMARMDGAPFHYAEFGHDAVAASGGAEGLARFARALLARTFGTRALGDLRLLAVTDWLGDPLSRSAWAVVPPGRVAIRSTIGEAVGERIRFAGEANSRSLWGTVGGAWQEGERAAEATVAAIRPRPGRA